MNEIISINKNKNITNCMYWCPKCNYTEKVDITSKVKVKFTDPIETLDIKNIPTFNPISIEMNHSIFCQDCKEEMVQIDNEILKAIVRLNFVGLKTEFSCSGHGRIDDCYIMFAPGISLPSIPKNWERMDGFKSLFVYILDPDKTATEYIREYIQPDSNVNIPYHLYIESLEEWVDKVVKDRPNISIGILPQENQFNIRADYFNNGNIFEEREEDSSFDTDSD